MHARREQSVDLLVIGAGIAGLWILDAAVRRGLSAVAVECDALGAGQSVCAQGIIHGGLKYALREKDLEAAGSISAMPEVWRRLQKSGGEDGPDLRGATLSSPCTWIWRTDSLASRIGFLGAKAALRTRPQAVEDAARPPLLSSVPGSVLRVEEPVFDTRSVLAALAAAHQGRIAAVDGPEGIELASRGGDIERAILRRGDEEVVVHPRCVVLAAGIGNERLLSRLGLDATVAQRRPLHMTLLRASGLPTMFGHCVDGNRTRVTITSGVDRSGRTVWQLGGELAERGVERDAAAQLATAASELACVLPDLDLGAFEDAAWATYRVDRAERRTRGGLRPDDAVVMSHLAGRLLVAWPTKWALAPRLAAAVLESMPQEIAAAPSPLVDLSPLPAPDVADFPWETCSWTPHRDVRSAAPA
jgi:glycerol-3-phosphate dehydrogenase